MSAYYNEIDPDACATLRALIAEGEIAPGVVDERRIELVQPSDLDGFTQVHLFAGTGGWSVAARLAGWPDGRELWSASLPCQPFSNAGLQRGLADDRHLWPHAFRLIAARRPAVLMGEQVKDAIGKHWLDRVFDDLESIDYACGSAIVPAGAVGAPHRRDRLWLVADPKWNEQSRKESCRGQARRMGRFQQPLAWNATCERALSELRVFDDGLPRSVAATDAARNAIVPQAAAEIIAAYMDVAP